MPRAAPVTTATRPERSMLLVCMRPEPISIFRACATEAIWDAVLDGGRRRVLDVHKGADGDEMRPNRPVPKGCRQNGRLLCCSSEPCAPDSVSRRVVRAGAHKAACDTLDPVRHAAAPGVPKAGGGRP